MYIFLDFLSELLERYSLIIVGGLIGALAIVLVWRKVPKPEHLLTKAQIDRIDRKVKAIHRKFHSSRPRIFNSALAIALVIWIVILIGFFGILTYLAIYYPGLLEKIQ